MGSQDPRRSRRDRRTAIRVGSPVEIHGGKPSLPPSPVVRKRLRAERANRRASSLPSSRRNSSAAPSNGDNRAESVPLRLIRGTAFRRRQARQRVHHRSAGTAAPPGARIRDRSRTLPARSNGAVWSHSPKRPSAIAAEPSHGLAAPVVRHRCIARCKTEQNRRQRHESDQDTDAVESAKRFQEEPRPARARQAGREPSARHAGETSRRKIAPSNTRNPRLPTSPSDADWRSLSVGVASKYPFASDRAGAHRWFGCGSSICVTDSPRVSASIGVPTATSAPAPLHPAVMDAGSDLEVPRSAQRSAPESTGQRVAATTGAPPPRPPRPR